MPSFCFPSNGTLKADCMTLKEVSKSPKMLNLQPTSVLLIQFHNVHSGI